MRRLLPALLVLLFAAPADLSAQADGVDKDHLPYRRHAVLPGKVVGLLVHKAQPILSTEGRSGPPDQVCFAADGNSYRWVYLPTFQNPRITNLQVPVGNKGEIDIYPSLDMANLPALAGWGVRRPVTLVEVEVNQGKGSPAIDSFVATNVRVLEGTKEYPLQVVDAVAEAEKRFEKLLQDKKAVFEKALSEVQKKTLPAQPATGPRKIEHLTFLTWHAKREVLEVRLRGTIQDGSFRTIRGGGIEPVPLPLPVPPRGRKLPPPPARPQGGLNGGPQQEAFVAFPPPPPREIEMRVGTAFGIHFGLVCEFDRHGKLLAERELPIREFVTPEQLPPGGPGGIRPRPLPLPLPPPPLPAPPPRPQG